MVVCHCEYVNDRTISEIIAGDVVTVEEVTARCGAGGRCGGSARTRAAWGTPDRGGAGSLQAASSSCAPRRRASNSNASSAAASSSPG